MGTVPWLSLLDPVTVSGVSCIIHIRYHAHQTSWYEWTALHYLVFGAGALVEGIALQAPVPLHTDTTGGHITKRSPARRVLVSAERLDGSGGSNTTNTFGGGGGGAYSRCCGCCQIRGCQDNAYCAHCRCKCDC